MANQPKSSGKKEDVAEYRDGSGRAQEADKIGGKKSPPTSGTKERESEYRDNTGRASANEKVGGKKTPKTGFQVRPASYRNRNGEMGINNTSSYRR